MNTTTNNNGTFYVNTIACADCFTSYSKYADAIITEAKKELAKDYKKAIESYTYETTILDNKEVRFDFVIKTKEAETFIFEAKLNKIDNNGVEYTDEKAKGIAFQLSDDVIKYLEKEGKEILHISSNLNELEKSSVVKAAFIVA